MQTAESSTPNPSSSASEGGIQQPEPFSYSRLDTGCGEFRLLDLQPLRSHSRRQQAAGNPYPLSIHLVQASLQTAPPYHALSYAWGDLTKTTPVLVNGATFNVTENLETALQQFSLKNSGKYLRYRYLWVDALCINQADNVEKSEQVRMMSYVYSLAQNVLVWLGPHQDESEQVFHQTGYARKALAYGINNLDWDLPRDPQTQQYVGRIPGLLRDLVLDVENSDGALLRAFANVFSRPWWRRVWVYQEFMLAEQVYFVCGNDSMRSEDLKALLHLLEYQRALGSREHRLPGQWKDFFRNAYWGPSVILRAERNPWSTLLTVLDHTTVAQQYGNRLISSDPRDHVFGVLDTLTFNSRSGVQVDYSKSCRDVFTEVAVELLSYHGLSVLSYCELLPRTLQKDIPSWAPDWSAIRTEPILGCFDRRHNCYSASEGADSPGHGFSYRGGGILSVGGSLVDCIRSVHQVIPKSTFTVETDAKSIRQWLASMYSSISKSHTPEDTPNPLFEVEEALFRATTGLPSSNTIILPGYTDNELHQAKSTFQSLLSSSGQDSDEESRLVVYLNFAWYQCTDRRIFNTSQGYIGSGSESVRIGDEVWILSGMEVPVILRPSSRCFYQLVSDSYVHGLMFGEYFRTPREMGIINLY